MNVEQIKKLINVLLESAKQHKRSSSMHRQQAKKCMKEASELDKLLSTERRR